MSDWLSVFSGPQWEAVGKSLLHFLWQGALLGLAAAAVLKAWPRRSPQARYGAACGFYLAMALSPLLTLALLWPNSGGSAAPQPMNWISLGPGDPSAVIGFEWQPWLVAFWVCGVALFTLRAAVGWGWILLGARRGREPAPAALRRRLAGLADALGIRRVVRVFVSRRVSVPSVFGWLRPVVLLPVSALTGLPPDQLEAILAHELAHVARHDFLVNCLQAVVEALLFYHPAVWWLSKRIREERELCCDAVAVEICGDRVMYSRALLALEESRNAFALAATGGSLKERIMQLLQPSEVRRTGSSLSLVIAALVLVVGGWCAVSAQTPPAPPAPPPAPPAAPTRATLPVLAAPPAPPTAPCPPVAAAPALAPMPPDPPAPPPPPALAPAPLAPTAAVRPALAPVAPAPVAAPRPAPRPAPAPVPET